MGVLGSVRGSFINNITITAQNYSGQSGTTHAVSARGYVGALAGAMISGQVNKVFVSTTGNIAGINYVGGLVGYGFDVPMGEVSVLRAAGTTDSNARVIGSNSYVGGILGSLSYGALRNIRSNLSVQGSSYTGGIAGFMRGDANYASLTFVGSGYSDDIGSTALSVTGDLYTGGIFGQAWGGSAANNWYATANVTGTSDRVGGLVGSLESGTYSNMGSTATTVTSSGAYTGGLVGSSDATMTNVSAVANVTAANAYVGGLIGWSSSRVVTNATATGVVRLTGGTDYVGGLIGYSYANVVNSSASGDVYGVNQYVGGLVGWQQGNTISGSYATGNVSVSNTNSGWGNVGGLVGRLEGATLANSTASGQVTGSAWVGGLVGYANSATITNTSASGSVIARYDYAGGLVGKQVAGTIADSNAIGANLVAGNTSANASYIASYVGGLVGHADTSSSMIRGSYANINVTATGDFVGGLVGLLEGQIQSSANASAVAARGTLNSWASGNVDGRYDVGGLVGHLSSTGTVVNASASVNVAANLNYGGLIGYMDPGAMVTNAHYNINSVQISAYSPASPSTRINLTGGVTQGGLYTDQYATWFNGGSLTGLSGNAANYFGAADANGFYSLSNIQNLKDYLGYADQSSLKFKLGADIDLNGAAGLYIPYVSGTFEGAGRTISNLNLSQSTSGLGFLGHLTGSGTVANITVAGNISGVRNL
ncbi:MAG: hypothetical protein EBZ77_11915, partial [Chitinophagia bacterium]|nr:hypothetical protein [Chitinophagia bacterium]